jgi:hypothetical protein
VKYVATYWRLGKPDERECDSVDDALFFLCSGQDHNVLTASIIRDDAGAVVMTEHEISDYYVERWAADAYAETHFPDVRARHRD